MEYSTLFLSTDFQKGELLNLPWTGDLDFSRCLFAAGDKFKKALVRMMLGKGENC